MNVDNSNAFGDDDRQGKGEMTSWSSFRDPASVLSVRLLDPQKDGTTSAVFSQKYQDVVITFKPEGVFLSSPYSSARFDIVTDAHEMVKIPIRLKLNEDPLEELIVEAVGNELGVVLDHPDSSIVYKINDEDSATTYITIKGKKFKIVTGFHGITVSLEE